MKVTESQWSKVGKMGGFLLPEGFDVHPGELVAIVGGGGKTSLMFRMAAELDGRTIVTTTTRIFAAQMKLAPNSIIYSGEDIAGLTLSLDKHAYNLIVGRVSGDKALGLQPELPAEFLKRPDVDYVLVEADGSRMRPSKAPADHEPVIPQGTTLVIPVIGIDALNGRVRDVAHRPERVKAIIGLEPGDVMTAEALAALLVHPNGGRKNVPPGARIIPFINKVDSPARLVAARQIARTVLEDPAISRVVIGAAQDDKLAVEVQARVTAVILAAGEANRMGRTKQLLPWGRTTVLGQTIQNAKASAVHDCLVVSGHDASAVETVAGREGIPAVHNPDYAEGEMLSSLQTAVRHLDRGPAAVLVMLADQPMVEPQTINQILTAFWQGQSDLLAPTFQGKRGNPVLIGRRYFNELLALPVGAAPRDLVERHRDKLFLVEVNTDSILTDLDKWTEYHRYRPKNN